MADGSLNRFLGDSPLRALVKLIFLSFIVGVVMAAVGLEPYDILDSLARFARNIYEMGFSAIDKALRYFLLGAVIVIPVWLILRITRAGRN
jgi:hypothetical protein